MKKLIFPIIMSIFLAWSLWARTAEAQPAGYQEYFVLGYEEHMWRAFMEINDDPDPSQLINGYICSTVSLVATADFQIVYYDHWEDGYEIDPLNPRQSTTEIYGDGNPANGGQGADILRAGDALNLTSDQSLAATPERLRYVPVSPARNPADIRYDGGDRILTSGGPINVTHAMWPYLNPWIGGAWENPARQMYEDTFVYRIPIGVDLYTGTNNPFGDFRNVYIQLIAFEDNTTVSINNLSQTINFTLDRGQTYFSHGYINSTPYATLNIPVHAGTVIRSNKPTQVGLVTGADGSFQGRSMIALPDKLWGADYAAVVPSGNLGDEAEVYMSNINDFPITVTSYDRFITETTFTISSTTQPSSTLPLSVPRKSLVPADTAARLTSPQGVFGVLIAGGTSETAYDWGVTGIPARFLTQDYYVSWAPGNACSPPDSPLCDEDPYTPGVQLAVNGSPVWVTPLTDNTRFYVDFNTPPNGLDGIVDQTFTLNALEQRRIFDPDKDNTGMHIWANHVFAAIWGVDARTAGPGSPYLDMGVTVMPMCRQWQDTVLTLDKTADPTILPPQGGVVTFTLVAHSEKIAMRGVDITDTLPIGWTYVPNSARMTYPGGSPQPLEPLIAGLTLFWDTSADLDQAPMTLTFQAQIMTAGQIGSTIDDSFESGTYNSGRHWPGNWQENGDDGSPSGGAITISNLEPFTGQRHLQLTQAISGTAIWRAIDLSHFTLPRLRFARQVNLSATSQYALDIQVAGQWTETITWSKGGYEQVYEQNQIDLPLSATAIRFRCKNTIAGDYLYIDQVEIYDAAVININQAQAVGRLSYSNAIFSPADQATVYISPLSLIKTVSRAQAQVGDTLIYTLTYANASSTITATQVMLRDILPIQYVTLKHTSPGGVFQGGSGAVVWSLGDLPPQASGQVTCSVQIKDFVQDNTIIENRAYIESEQADQAGSNTAQTIVQSPNVRLTKQGPAVCGPGDPITYTLFYQNIGQTTAQQVIIHDMVPISTTYLVSSLAINTGSGWVSLSEAADADQGSFVSNTLIITPGLTPGTLTAGESGWIRLSVRPDLALPPGAPVLNWATYDHSLDIPRDSNLVITRIADLLLDKTAQPETAVPGQMITYTLTYHNISAGSSHTQVYIWEAIPVHTSLVAATLGGSDALWYSWDNGQTFQSTMPATQVTHLRWYDAELPPLTAVTLTLTVRVSNPLPPNTTIQNMAHISSTQTSAYLKTRIPSRQVNVPTLDVQIDKQAGTASIAPGAVLTYTILYGNRGSAAASNVFVRDQIHPLLTPIVDSISPPALLDGRRITWTINLAAQNPQTTLSFAAAVAITATCGQTITNDADLSHPLVSAQSAPVTVTVTAPYTAAFAVTPTLLCLNRPITLTNLSQGADNFLWNLGNGVITTTVSPVYAYSAPDNYTVTLTATTRCGSSVYSRTLSIPPPPIASFTPALTQTYTGLPVHWTNTSSGAVGAVWDLGDGTITTTLSPTHAYSLPGLYTITLTAVSACGYTDVTTGTVRVLPPTLSVTKSAWPAPVAAGYALTYTIRVSNTSPGYATGIWVSDTLPLLTSFIPNSIKLEPSGIGQVGIAPPQLAQDIHLGPGQSLTLTWMVQVAPTLPGGVETITNTVWVSSAQGAAAAATLTTPVIAWPDLVVTKQSDVDESSPGRLLTYTLTISNVGSQDASGVQIQDILPLYTSFISASHGGIETAPGSGVAQWPPISLVARQTITRLMIIQIGDPLAAGIDVITNVVSAADDGRNGPDPTPTNNIFTLTTEIGYVPALTLTKTGPAWTAVGQRITWTFTVSHNLVLGDGSLVSNLAVVDSLAGPASYLGGDADGDGLLGRNEQWAYRASYIIRPTDPSPLISTATVSGRDQDHDLVTATTTHQTLIDFAPAIQVRKQGPASAQVGQTVTFTLIVGNVSYVPTALDLRAQSVGDGSPIYHVTVSDNVAGPATYVQGDNGDGILQVGESWIYIVCYTVQESDPDMLTNTATATGQDGNGQPISDSHSHSMQISRPLKKLFLPLIFKNYQPR